MDNSFTEEEVEKYKLYAQAFFPNTVVDVLKRPDFLTKAKVECRDSFYCGGKQYRTCGKNGILNKLPMYKPMDAYAVAALTNLDLYPNPNWSFCFGWASFTEGVGTFSFRRYDPEFDGIDDPDREKNLLMRSCHIMTHEIGHMFGLRHCIYYECLMNGLMSANE